jgi:hypothetical protein
MSHSRREQTYRDLRDSRPTQDERDREANAILHELADIWDKEAVVESVIDDDTTGRVQITSMDARLAELVDEHDSSSPLFPEFARRRTDVREFDLDDFRAGLDVTQTDLPALPDQEPSWTQVLRMGIVDVAKEVLP